MFCSENCKEQAHTPDLMIGHFTAEFLKFTKASGLDSDPYFYKFPCLLLAKFLKIAGSIEDLQRLLKDPLNRTAFDIDWSDPYDEDFEKNKLIVFLSLYRGAEKQRNEFALTAAKLALKGAPISHEQQEFLAVLFSLMFNIYKYNGISTAAITFGGGRNFEEVGRTILLLGSMFNHSCDPNLIATFYDNKFVFVVNRPIKAESQLFVSYR